MAKKVRKSAQELSSRKPAWEAPKKSTILGPDHALNLPIARGTTLPLSYWDLWFALVAVLNYDGDLDRLAQEIKEEKSTIFYHRDSIERKRCHLRDLKRRLEEASVTPTEIVSAAANLAKTEKRRALKMVMDQLYREREFSEPMRDTPRKRRFAHAQRGYWDHFPVSPEPYAEKIGAHFRSKGFYSESMSFRIAGTLDRYTEKGAKLLEAGKAAQAQALLRAEMAVILELMEKADDSCGAIGMSFDDGFAAYLKIPLEQTGIDDAVFFRDLLDFVIWEDYGLTNDVIEGYFRRLNEIQAEICVQHLRRQVTELLDEDLEYQSEEALTLLGQVISEQERFDEFEDVAKRMGSRAWKRIIRLVDRAMSRRKKPLAIRVFEAAMTNGYHLDFLTKKYEKLKRGDWSPDPKK